MTTGEVRVTVARVCPMQCVNGEVIVHIEPLTFIPKPCPTCHGRGVVDEPVSCAGCKHFDRYGYTSAGWCRSVENPDAPLHLNRPEAYCEVSSTFACSAWEPRS